MTTEPTFTPRKEFNRIPLPVPDSFAHLALSGSNCIRLYSFPAFVLDALRCFLERLSMILFSREDSHQSLCEFALDGKPWANPKAVSTEKLLLDILVVIYQCGYSYLSTVDYGRESDDRLAMVFSKRAAPFSNSQTTTSPPSSMVAFTSSLNDKEKVQRVPFGLSFASATFMRVIAPPLHLTPAILQAVRASWPRGIVSEKKVGDNSYEFRLKGYKWFQQDTFAADSLRHILALLTSLDSHSFSLLTSISLTNRSRVKDLWIFTGPAPQPSPSVVTDERNRCATEPIVQLPSQHSRSITDGPLRLQYPVSQLPQPHLLRKPAPRAQVPVSVYRDFDIPDEHHLVLRAHIPSTISAGIENMTGVGAVGLKQGVSFLSSPPSTPPPKVGGPTANACSDLRLGFDIVPTPPLLTSISPNQRLQLNAKNEKPISSTNAFLPPPLLGLGVFRDSAFSSSTTSPISWAGPPKEDAKNGREKPRLTPSYSSNGPMFPGAWQSTPVDEKPAEETEFSMLEGKDTPSTFIQENDCGIEAPTMVSPDMTLRKSEAALVGIIASTSDVSSIPQRDKSLVMKKSQNSSGNRSQGWVLVNVEGSSATSRAHESKGSNSPLSASLSAPSVSESPALEPSSAAKAIVIIDAMDSKRKKRSTMQPKASNAGSTGLKRFFSLHKKSMERST